LREEYQRGNDKTHNVPSAIWCRLFQKKGRRGVMQG